MPVGRRLAFDARRGRLWVVCPSCRRWNLCPFEERWEALEECERAAASSLAVAATDEVSLLRHSSGVSLIRLGRAPLRELIPWRFVRSLSRRRRDYLIGLGVVGAGSVALLGGTLMGGGVMVSLLNLLLIGRGFYEAQYPVIRLDAADGRHLKIPTNAARGMNVEASEGGGFSVHISTTNRGREVVRGDALRSLLARALPLINEGGAPRDVADAAGKAISDSGGSEAFLQRTLSDRGLLNQAVWKERSGVVSKLPAPTRIALEAAVHLDLEDSAMEGELPSIIAQWREEEPIAEIADGLIDPPGWDDFKGRHSGGR